MLSVVVGGQYGSEGKGKVAQYLAAERDAAAVVRVGGSNSGHTGFLGDGEVKVLRQLPTAALLPDALCVLGPGSYVDIELLLREVEETNLHLERLKIDYRAFAITDDDEAAEATSGQIAAIGSTGSGTGAAVTRRIRRLSSTTTVRGFPAIEPFLADTTEMLRRLLAGGERVIIEGTQGFGLSLLHSPYYPYVTSRDTSAAGAVSEAGLSPRDVDEVVLVLRAFPIRVGGNSGPLPNEITWETVAAESGSRTDLSEYTSVTGRLRRVARFDPDIARRAIAVNQPSMIVLNHIDQFDADCATTDRLSDRGRRFIAETSRAIGQRIDLVGLGPSSILDLTKTSPVRLAL
jgi:adenylosuccinate synthase